MWNVTYNSVRNIMKYHETGQSKTFKNNQKVRDINNPFKKTWLKALQKKEKEKQSDGFFKKDHDSE